MGKLSQAQKAVFCEICMYGGSCDGLEYTSFCMAQLNQRKREEPDSSVFSFPEISDSKEKSEETKIQKDESGENQIRFISGFLDFLNQNGFAVDSECLSQIITVLSGIPKISLEEQEIFLKPVLVKNQAEDQVFHTLYLQYLRHRDQIVVDSDTESWIRNNLSQKSSFDRQISKKEKAILEKEKEIESIRNQESEGKETEKGEEKWKKSFRKIQKEYQSLVEKGKKKELKEKILQHAEGNYCPSSQTEEKEMEEFLKDMLKRSITSPKFKELMAFLKKQIVRLKKDFEESKNSGILYRKEKEEQLSQMKSQKEELQSRLDQLMKDMKSQVTQIQKAKSETHRKEFIREKAKNFVKSSSSGEVLDKEFQKLTKREKEQIRDYIKENARQFRTRMLHNRNTNNREKLDLSETCRKACETGGIPMRLYYKKKVKSQAKVMLFLDISGSCKEVSELMLSFLYEMKEIFPGGCRTYVFINQLYDVSEFMEAPDAETAVNKIMGAIPRAGVYSDYNRPFQEFYQNHMSEISSDTLVFFIGDARNNRNPSGEEYVKAIARKSKKAFWMNADPYEKWDQGDSIISTYAKYMNQVGEVLTPNQLLDFLVSIRG